jgi:hypothetical protein
MQDALKGIIAEVGSALESAEQRSAVSASRMRNAVRGAMGEINQILETTEEASTTNAARLREIMKETVAEFDAMLKASDEKSAGASKAMRESVKGAIDDAIERFHGATDEIRRSSGDIRKELAETREELKRGAFDLPEETRENAAAMRRAVADQIQALQDLSQIVSQSAERVEVARPASQGSHRAEPPRLRGSLGAEASAPAASASALAPSSEPAPKGSGGWVSDLLRGASRAETTPPARPAQPAASNGASRDERKPRHVVESLNSLSMDIARAIDHDASVELWRRYQRGERDVFTRRLYTLKGQQTFDDIKRKYEREPEFRTAVDRYIADFEKLLADVSRNDRDNVMTQTYLTSDTGKVYTMLAHASGRFNKGR